MHPGRAQLGCIRILVSPGYRLMYPLWGRSDYWSVTLELMNESPGPVIPVVSLFEIDIC